MVRLRVLDLDGSLTQQPALAQRSETVQVVPMDDLADGLRLWATTPALEEFRRRLNRLAEPAGEGPVVTFLGSGDFHHLAALLIERAAGPVSVVHFDNHPDWVRFPPAWHCGSWVNRVLDMDHVARVVTIGPCGGDLDWPQLKGANLAALASGRLRMYPWRHAPSRLLGGGRLDWECLGEAADWAARFAAIVKDLPTERVWVTVDKDVLRPEDADTNWDQGEMPLSVLVAALKCVGRLRKVIGIDVCGEYSPPVFGSPLKRLSAWLDHPSGGVPKRAVWRNSATNQMLLEAFAEMVR